MEVKTDEGNDLKTAALLCSSSEIWSSNVLRVVTVLAQIRAERLYLETYAAARKGAE